VADLSVVGSGVKWYDSSNTVLTSGSVLADGVYSATQTISGCESLSRLDVTVTINKPVAPTTTNANPVFCNSATVADLSVLGTGVKWYDSSNNVLTPGSVLANGVYSATQTISGCKSLSRLDVTVTINKPAAPTTTNANPVFCNSATVADLSVLGTGVKWYDSSNNVLTSGSVLTDGVYSATQTISGCESLSRLDVTVTINKPAAPTTTNANPVFCNSATVADLSVLGTGVKWYDSSNNVLTSGSVLASGVYSATQTISGCESLSRLDVTVTISKPAAPTTTNANPIFCNSATVADLSVLGTGVKWYDSSNNVLTSSSVLANGVYSATQTISGCESLSRLDVTVTINKPAAPTTTNANPVFCNSATVADLSVLGTGVKWYDSSNTVLTSGSVLTDGVYSATQTISGCESLFRLNVTVARPLAPKRPSLTVIQPTCSTPFGTIEMESIPGIEYSIGNGYRDNAQFLNLAPNNYKVSVRFKDNTSCETFVDQVINPIPLEIQFESTWTCQSNKYQLTASPLSNSYDPTAVEYIWKDKNGRVVGTNSNILNVNDVIDATAETETFPLVYTLTVKSNSSDCEKTSNIVIESIYCDIQKGISPDGNGSNDYFDLRLMDVKKLEVFNRYGIQVYSQSNYTDQWHGQTNNGEELPSATYYYVIEFNNGQSKTGWIYLIRED
jgi:gliding motility-associated-like protein